MKRKVVMRLLCISIVSAMLVSKVRYLPLADAIERQAVHMQTGYKVAVILNDDGTVRYVDETGTEQIVSYNDFLNAGWQIVQLEPEPQPEPEPEPEPEPAPQPEPEPAPEPQAPEDTTDPGSGQDTDPAAPGGEDSTDPAGSESPADPSSPEGTDPGTPAEPGETDPADPTAPGGTEVTDPNGAESTDPNGTDPTDPTDPADPNGTDPTDPSNPADPSGTETTDPNGTDPANPDGTVPADPGVTDPTAPAEEPAKPLDGETLAPDGETTSSAMETLQEPEETPPLILEPPEVTAGVGFYIEELEDKYHLSFAEDFADVVDGIEDSFIAKVKAANEPTESEAPDVRYLMMVAELAKGDEQGEREMEVLVEEALDARPIANIPQEEGDGFQPPEMEEEGLPGLDMESLDRAQSEESAGTTDLRKPQNEVEFRNWQDVLAVYLLNEHRQGADHYQMDASDKEALAAVFEQMNTGALENGKVVVSGKTASDYETENAGSLSEEDRSFLDRYTSPNSKLLCAAATGIPGFITESFGEEISEERAQVVAAAYSLIGKVSYFWGGKSSVIGWDSRWGKLATVTAAGVSDTGKVRRYGLDCSGFVTWAFINGYEDKAVASAIGQGSATQWGRSVKITEEEALPGDLVFLQSPAASGINHVGIVVGRNDDGKLVVVHCNAGDNGVVVESAYSAGFRYIRRPLLYQDGTV